MVFSSFVFLFAFLPVVLALYFGPPALLRGRAPKASSAWRALVLVVASYAFYGWERYWYVFLILGSTLLDLTAGRVLASTDRPRVRRAALVTSLAANLALLGYFKYRDFAIDAVLDALTLIGLQPSDPNWVAVTLPVGISFYTFQSMSYTIDVYRGVVQPLPWRRALDFVAYVALFPQLVAGPIVRFRDLADQLVERRHDLRRFGEGVFFFMCGFVKKVLIANQVGGFADALFAAKTPGASDAWIGITAYAVQIYFDFSGYSDMAIGLGRFFGFEFPRNFLSPYRAASLTDFWRRWHVSLSTWLRDYLYVPLGGNRGSRAKTYRNLVLTMLLGGLWHGAHWTFVIWGAWHGAWLALERAMGRRAAWSALPRPLAVAATFVVVLLGWVVFRAPTLTAAADVFVALAFVRGLGEFSLAGPHSPTIEFTAGAVGLIVAFAARRTDEVVVAPSWPRLALTALLFSAALIELLQSTFNPFLYYQF